MLELHYPSIHKIWHHLTRPLQSQPVTPSDLSAFPVYIPRLFALPQVDKDMSLVRSPRFFGYSCFNFGTLYAAPVTFNVSDSEELYLCPWDPAQWPTEGALSDFLATFKQYLVQVEVLSFESINLLVHTSRIPPHPRPTRLRL
ncbi:hypothetical protein OBBRIDRAFT_839807 [Obba rivulosa]|uniref:Uncharacterized protein n=1 Tax=Obba rivulosa TaxID=1052685 RepID=A0A8E2DJ19_9APHY|nr:hypothetical protein OBBRIDRAFT_839807 [Obba rivulosa]